MSLDLTVLGSGSAHPAPGPEVRNPAGFAVRAGESLLVFDLGFGNVRQLARAGLDPVEVEDVFLTHLHPDHCGDLPALLFTLHSRGRDDGRLRVWGPAGTAALVKNLSRAWSPWLDPRGYALEVRELADGAEVQGVGWVVESKAVPHSVPALAYRLTRNSSSLVYSGDMEDSASFPEFAAACDLLLIECTASEDDRLPGHLTAREALALSRKARAASTLLVHLNDESAAEAERVVKDDPRAGLARDLMRRRI